jgi:hypothetical protein
VLEIHFPYGCERGRETEGEGEKRGEEGKKVEVRRERGSVLPSIVLLSN